MFRKLDQDELPTVLPLVDREHNFIMYNNLHTRQDRAYCVGDYTRDQLEAFACYLTGLPFHAYSLQLGTEAYTAEHPYPVRELLYVLNRELKLEVTEDAPQTGYLTLAEEDAKRIVLEGLQSTETFLLMKLTDPSRLLPAQGATRLDGSHSEIVDTFVKQVGMMSFRTEEVDEFPHLGIFEKGKLVALAGFHIYRKDYAEIGNIGTLPEQRGKGFGKRATSEICHLARNKTDDVYLFVFEENKPAVRVYETLGFETVQRYSFLQFTL